MEGGLSIDPGWFQLWRVGDIDRLNREYEVAEFARGFTGFGSSGGGEMLAFDGQGRIVMIPFVGMDPNEAVLIAESWDQFTKAMEG